MRGRWILGISLVILSIALAVAAVFRMDKNAEEERQAQEAVAQVLAQVPAQEPDLLTEPTEEERQWYGEEFCAVLEFPDLDLILPVLDHYTEAEMKRTPCVYSGSLEENDLVITAHNYRHHFGRLSELELGASLIFQTKSGEEFHFRLVKIEELAPTDVEPMLNSQWPLTLYTCTFDQTGMLTLRWGYWVTVHD